MKNLLKTRRPFFSIFQTDLIKYLFLLFAFSAGMFCGTSYPPAEATCVEDPTGVVTCTGDETAGINYSSGSINELRVIQPINNIVPASGTTGINLNSSSGGNVTVKSGDLGSNININTINAAGISLQSSGTSSAPSNSVLGFPLPGSGSASGGIVSVESHSNITATSNSIWQSNITAISNNMWVSACGIFATSSTTGYSQDVITSLQHFDPASVSFQVVSVNNSAANINRQVQATRIDAGGTAMQGDGGTITISDLGVPTYIPGTAFADLQDGETGRGMVSFQILQTSSVTGGSLITNAYLMITATRTNSTLTYAEAVYYPDYGVWSIQDSQNPAALLPVYPNLQNYIAGLISDATEGGAGNSVSVTSTGRIKTDNRGASINVLGYILGAAPGIFAQSQGASGGTGSGGGLFDGPAGVGGLGRRGGDVTGNADGEIITLGNYSAGVMAASLAGNGGTGGDGGLGGWRWGGPGGTGGNGGSVSISGSGTIITGADLVGNSLVPTGYGDYSSGIVAISQGGNGGNGGEGHQAMPGGAGGKGGRGGAVSVGGSWNITTMGNWSHGIWAKSVGGGAGSGGSAGWIGIGSGGSGGEAADGGSVTVTSRGGITTWGNDSYGILGQSVGGFGGNGGGGDSLFCSSGGDASTAAGSGSDVNITNDTQGTITTYGDRAHAIYAESVGGGGGAGGGGDAIVALGGTGGSGGNGGAVTVTNNGVIKTYGEEARGVYAQSVGGGGGDGAAVDGLWAEGGGTRTDNTVGGGGDRMSNGGSVTVANTNSITTNGNYSEGIFAESVGGGGGAGGRGRGIKAIGGDGTGGGNGGDVTVTNDGSISTAGNLSRGIFVHSIGGGGGVGGGTRGWWSTGGSGSTTGDGGTISVTNRGTIETAGISSSGIFAQSGGGGGGDGGNAESFSAMVGGDWSESIGGNGGAGGDGGQVTVTNENTIITHGLNSHGIVAESVGGGGGSGGDVLQISAVIALPVAVPAFNISLTLGGNGNAAGDGGTVNITNREIIATDGIRSHGILAQSIGGGGGTGGDAVSYNLCFNCAINMETAIGGSGGAGGVGKMVTVYNYGTITTQGDQSVGILAQSVGGGGGAGGDTEIFSAGLNAPMSPDLEEFIPSPSATYRMSMGGSGGAGNDGGEVRVTNYNSIDTSGSYAHGILAQSVGGGGGVGGYSDILTFNASANPIDYIPAVGFLYEHDTTIELGGGPGSSGAGGIVNVINDGTITTHGASAFGIFAQSVGGGGGAEDSTIDVHNLLLSYLHLDSLQIHLRGVAGGMGDGKGVTVANNGTILTYGDAAHGIVAQSIGGGGGSIGAVDPLGITSTEFGSTSKGILTVIDGAGTNFFGSLGGYGSGGSVSITNTGNITTLGRASNGILAQSAGGTSAGDINVTTSGSIYANGLDSSGIFAQSVGGSSGGNISIIINSGTVQGGSGTGAGVYFMDGSVNSLVNRGTISTMDGIAGLAVRGTGGNETIDNYGIINGSVDLGSGVNSFNNNQAGILNSGAVIYLGAGNTFTNAGTFSPGGSGIFQTTNLTGNFAQTSAGTLDMHIDANGNNDKLLVASGSAVLDGTLKVTKGRGLYRNGMNYEILKTMDGTVTGTFDAVSLPDARPLLSFDVHQQPDAVEIEVHALQHTSVTTNPLESSIADYLDRITPTATGDLANVLGEFQSLPSEQFHAAFASMSPASYDGLTRASVSGLRRYLHSLTQRMGNVYNASVTGPRAETKDALLVSNWTDTNFGYLSTGKNAEHLQASNGLWLDSFGQWGNQNGTDGITGYHYKLYGSTIGYDHIFPTNVMLGFSLGDAQSNIHFDESLGKGSVRGLIGSIYGGYYTSDVYMQSIFSYGVERYHNLRHLSVGSIQRDAVSDHGGTQYSGYLEGGYSLKATGLAIVPYISLFYAHISEKGFTESGADSLDLIVAPRKTDSLISDLGVKVRKIFKLTNGSVVPELNAAFSYDFGIGNRIITGSFAGSPGSAFSVDGQKADKCGAFASTGFAYNLNSGFSISLKYFGELRERSSSNGILGDLRYQF